MVMEARTLNERYHLERKLASGAMGTVFLARDDRLHRKVAVKLLNESLAGDERFVERFRREARAAAGLSHPNIANIFDYGEEAGCYYIVMEYVPGRDLAQVIAQDSPLSAERTCAIGLQIARALEAAHAQGIVHRDIKPANVIVTQGGKVKVTDFGIARAAGDTTLTATGSVLGTARYLSPEQARGEEAGPASDIYSTGIVLYEMLTGTVPFTQKTALAVAMQHMNEDVPGPGLARQEVPPRVDALVRKATARDVDKRFGSAAALIAAIDGAFAPDDASASTLVPPTQDLRPTTGEPAAFPGTRWEAARLGKLVLGVFLALILLTAALALIRVASNDPARRAARVEARRTAAGSTPGRSTPAPAPALVTIPTDLIGLEVKEAEERLEGLGLNATIDPFAEVDKGIVMGSNPEGGSEVQEGDTVTLFVSPEEEGKDEDREDEDDGPPGKAKGHDKKGDD